MIEMSRIQKEFRLFDPSNIGVSKRDIKGEIYIKIFKKVEKIKTITNFDGNELLINREMIRFNTLCEERTNDRFHCRGFLKKILFYPFLITLCLYIKYKSLYRIF